MDPIKPTRGRKPINYLNDDLKLKQQKRHEYYIKFKSNHPDYYKKIKKVENDVPKENVELNKIDNIIKILKEQLIELIRIKNLNEQLIEKLIENLIHN